MKKLYTHAFKVTIYDNGFCWKNPRWEEKTYTHFDDFLSNMKTVELIALLAPMIF